MVREQKFSARDYREVCTTSRKIVQCNSMIRLTQSVNPEQAGNATEYLRLHHHQFSRICEKELNNLEPVQKQLDKFKLGPLPPNRCESVQYVSLTKCVTAIKTPKLGSADSNCNLYNHCNETFAKTMAGIALICYCDKKVTKPREATFREEMIPMNNIT